MKLQRFFGAIVAVTLSTVPAAMGMQGWFEITRKSQVMAQWSTETSLVQIYGASFDHVRSPSNGEFQVMWTDETGSYFAMYCTGPSLAGAVSVTPGSGRSVVRAVLDPSDPNCSATDNITAPLSVEAIGMPDGMSRSSTHGAGISTYSGATMQTNSQEDSFSEQFTIELNDRALPATGWAAAMKQNYFQRVK